ncbi:3-ketoacyl-ACP reductase, partial [Streptomyces lasiicapitis]
ARPRAPCAARCGRDGTRDEIDAAMLDAHWTVDTRAVILLVQAYARLRAGLPPRTPGGRVMMMTSGQDIAGGMPDELAYALQKGALASVTRSRATGRAHPAAPRQTGQPRPRATGQQTGHAVHGKPPPLPARAE